MRDAFSVEVLKRLKSLMKDCGDVKDAQLVLWSVPEQLLQVSSREHLNDQAKRAESSKEVIAFDDPRLGAR